MSESIDKGDKIREIDFLVVNYTYQYILKLECKNTFKGGTGKLKDQLKRQKDFLCDWLRHISDDWTLFSGLFAKDGTEDVNCTRHCNKYVMTNEKDLEDFIGNVHKRPIRESRVPIEEFKTIVKLFLYCSSNSMLEFGTKFYQEMDKAMEIQGSIKSIKLWCFPTPQQKEVLDKNHLLFWSTWGTGKTLLMTWKTTKLSRINPN